MGLCNILTLLLIFGSVPLWVIILNSYNYYHDYFGTFFETDPPDVFDFIIVGGGSAGATIANRLSKNNKVLLLEAGGDPIFLHKIPFLAPALLHRKQHDWNYETVPQPHGYWSAENNISTWPRGKALGGSSNLNYMLYVRGHPLDYDNWANLTGDSTWKYENVLPYFKKSLDYHGEHGANEKHYGSSPYGKLHVESRDWRPLHGQIMDAVKELGYEEYDLNGPQRSGFGPLEVTQKRGYRFGTFSAFIEPILDRKNLYVSRYSQATKIKVDKSGRAVGVFYVRHGQKKFAKASKEIIVSAGAVDSPKLLMLSGIGPAGHLKSVGIKPRVNLPVGKNLVDHLVSSLPNIVIDEPLAYNIERDFTIFGDITEYILNGTGMMTVPAFLTDQGFISTSAVRKAGVDWPNLQIYFAPAAACSITTSEISNLFRQKYDVWDSLISQALGKDGFTVAFVLVRPKSVGEITLQDKNPFSPPIIDPHYLEHPDDVKALVEGVQFSLDLIEKTETFKKLNATLTEGPLLGCEQHKFRSPAYWECYVRHMVATLYHPVGTCRMGKGSQDPEAVVDSKLRVLHTRGLRVADASIMPVIVNGNTNAPTIMIGEKAADFIREHWAHQYLVCPRSPNYYFSINVNDNDKCYYSRLT